VLRPRWLAGTVLLCSVGAVVTGCRRPSSPHYVASPTRAQYAAEATRFCQQWKESFPAATPPILPTTSLPPQPSAAQASQLAADFARIPPPPADRQRIQTDIIDPLQRANHLAAQAGTLTETAKHLGHTPEALADINRSIALLDQVDREYSTVLKAARALGIQACFE
jgi:hypothetical protein